MIRSLSFIHLFVILAVGYIGGALLFRELQAHSVEKMLAIMDARVVDGHDVLWIWPALMMIGYFALVLVLSKFKQTRFLIIFVGALKSVIFGLSSSYLLATGLKMVEYTVWWFPFQFITCFLFLVFCVILAPPFFLKTIGKRKQNPKVLPVLLGLIAVLTTIEMTIFYVLL